MHIVLHWDRILGWQTYIYQPKTQKKRRNMLIWNHIHIYTAITPTRRKRQDHNYFFIIKQEEEGKGERDLFVIQFYFVAHIRTSNRHLHLIRMIRFLCFFVFSSLFLSGHERCISGEKKTWNECRWRSNELLVVMVA